MSRLKLKYSKSEIANNLYTFGNEWMTTNKQEYKGLYHRYTLTNEAYTGAEWNESASQKLWPFIKESELVAAYNQIKKQDVKQFNKILPIQINITPQDAMNGYIYRYFLKKSNNNTNSYYYLIRLFLSKILIKFINLITNTKLSDPLSGFFLVKKNLVIKYKKEFFSSGFKIMLDIYLSRINKLKTKEIAITLNERKNGHSKINFGILTKIIQLIFYHFFRKHLKKIKEVV